ncbi:MAG TPA: FecR domain-containing protein [Dyadobacter sp.]|jgi:ferric-dicitrate binding protein FerR (iron transport regulator)|nr:FecR domain-containing protein [Dyadobacter sp.]
MITRELLQKLREGTCSRQELALIQTYFETDKLDEIQAILEKDWKDTADIQDVCDPLVPEIARHNVWAKLSKTICENEEPEVVRQKLTYSGWHLAAASVAVLSFAMWLLWFVNHGKSEHASGNRVASGWVNQFNNTQEPMQLKLPDGSMVKLASGSAIRYKGGFEGNIRSVKLTGEAFFDVEKDALRPFSIQTTLIKIQVLGTSFRVREAGNVAEVDVRSGKVKVESNRSGNKVFLGPNQRVLASRSDGMLRKSIVAQPQITNSVEANSKMEFHDKPVAEIFAQLSTAYQIAILSDEAVLENCTVTARFTDQQLFTRLDMICSSIGATYTVEGGSIRIHGKGCGY